MRRGERERAESGCLHAASDHRELSGLLWHLDRAGNQLRRSRAAPSRSWIWEGSGARGLSGNGRSSLDVRSPNHRCRRRSALSRWVLSVAEYSACRHHVGTQHVGTDEHSGTGDPDPSPERQSRAPRPRLPDKSEAILTAISSRASRPRSEATPSSKSLPGTLTTTMTARDEPGSLLLRAV